MTTAKNIASEINKGLNSKFGALAASAAVSTALGEDAVIIDFFQAPKEAKELEKLNAKLHLRLRVHGKGWKKGAPAPKDLHVETLRHTPVKRGGVKMRKGKTTPEKVADKVLHFFHKNEYRLKGGDSAKLNPSKRRMKQMAAAGAMSFALASGAEDTRGLSRAKAQREAQHAYARSTKNNPLGTLPAAGKAKWESVYATNLMRNQDEATSARIAWSVVKKDYEKKGNRWVKRTRRNPGGRTMKNSGIEIDSVRSKSGPSYQLKIDGKAGRIGIRGYTSTVFIGTDTLTRTLAEQVTVVNRSDGSGKALPWGARNKIVDAVLARLRGLEALETMTAKANPSKRGNVKSQAVGKNVVVHADKDEKGWWVMVYDQWNDDAPMYMYKDGYKSQSTAFNAGMRKAKAIVKRQKTRKLAKLRSNPSLGWKDKEVILHFFEHNAAKSSFLNTDGRHLYLANGDKVATWKGKKVNVKAKGKSGSLVEKALCRMAPASMLSGCKRSSMRNPSGSTWVKSKEDGKDVWVYNKDFATKKFPFAEVLIKRHKDGDHAVYVRDALYDSRDILPRVGKGYLDSLADSKKQAEKWISKNRIKQKPKWSLFAPRANPGHKPKHSLAKLEGPFTFPNGRTVYYDPGVGEYYDRSTDIYLSRDEAWDLHTRKGKSNPKKKKATAAKRKKSSVKKSKGGVKRKKPAVKRKKAAKR